MRSIVNLLMSRPGVAAMKGVNKTVRAFDDPEAFMEAGFGNTPSYSNDVLGDFVDIAFTKASGVISNVRNSRVGQATKSASQTISSKVSQAGEYLKSSNMSPQNFIQGYERNIQEIANERSIQGFDLQRFLNKGDSYEGLDAGMAAMRKEVLQGIDSEKFFTKRGMEGMLENFDATGNLYSGFNKAGETQGSPLINLLSGTTDNAAKNAAGLLGTAALAGGVNTMMGGDFGEGAMVGGLAAFSARGISQAYMRNMGNMETSFMKKTLGDSYVAGGKISRRTPITNIPKDQADILTMKDIGFTSNKTITDQIAEKGPYKRPPTTRETVNPRIMNLRAISNLETKEAKAFIERKGPNRVMAHNRSMTIGGGMLAGVAFTGRSDKRDYRRGFNSHRGNRI